MELFQSGKNLEAASRFALFAKKYPRHLLASHALYWAGEASARAQQWSIAMENWEELQKAYPRSAYVPEALAGLARAYEKQGNPSKAQMYRSTLMKAFPKSPVALSLNTTAAEPTAQPQPAADEQIPSYDEESSGEGE
jgi:TolA-binding protein